MNQDSTMFKCLKTPNNTNFLVDAYYGISEILHVKWDETNFKSPIHIDHTVQYKEGGYYKINDETSPYNGKMFLVTKTLSGQHCVVHAFDLDGNWNTSGKMVLFMQFTVEADEQSINEFKAQIKAATAHLN